MNQIILLWRGEMSLQNAFWNWAVFGGLIVNVISSGLFLALALNDQIMAAILIGKGGSLPYNLLVCVGVFRSADRYRGNQRWSEIVKVITVVWIIFLSVT